MKVDCQTPVLLAGMRKKQGHLLQIISIMMEKERAERTYHSCESQTSRGLEARRHPTDPTGQALCPVTDLRDEQAHSMRVRQHPAVVASRPVGETLAKVVEIDKGQGGPYGAYALAQSSRSVIRH